MAYGGYDMNEQTLTLALDGDVPLHEFAVAMTNFNALANSLSAELTGHARIEWIIDSLASGSAVATIRGITDSPQALNVVTTAYARVGKALQTNQPIPFSDQVGVPARKIVGLLDSRITSIRFETPTEDVVIASSYREGKADRRPTYSIGTLKGVVESLSRRRGVRFTIYDAIFDRPIACYLQEGQEERIASYWGKRVLVTGQIGRDSESGKAFAIRNIVDVAPVDSSEPGSYRKARGVIRKEGAFPVG
jgi:hypothetical protein